MKLYFSAGSCSLSPHIALCEAGLLAETESVNLRVMPHITASGIDFSTINPKGYVPVLVLDNGDLLTEGAAIVQYLADQAPEKKLAPPNGTIARYHLQEWLNFISTEIHKGFSPLWKPAVNADVKQATISRLEKHFSWLESQLAGKPYLMGEFTVADGYLFTCLNWSTHLKVSLNDWPELKAYTARVMGRPAVQQALKREGLL